MSSALSIIVTSRKPFETVYWFEKQLYHKSEKQSSNHIHTKNYIVILKILSFRFTKNYIEKDIKFGCTLIKIYAIKRFPSIHQFRKLLNNQQWWCLVFR